jgi:putative NADH-flavin reductase
MKKILLYGATGRTGSKVLQYAIQKGYQITALVRNPEKVHFSSEMLKLIQGNPYNIEDVRSAIVDCEAVISTLGNNRTSTKPSQDSKGPVDLMAKSIQNTVQIMNEIGIKRIVIQTSAGTGESIKYVPGIMRWIFNRSFFKIIQSDQFNQEQALRQSDLDWTIVRPFRLTNSEQLKELHIHYEAPVASNQISRLQVAKFLVDCLENEEFYHKSPMLCEK